MSTQKYKSRSLKSYDEEEEQQQQAKSGDRLSFSQTAHENNYDLKEEVDIEEVDIGEVDIGEVDIEEVDIGEVDIEEVDIEEVEHNTNINNNSSNNRCLKRGMALVLLLWVIVIYTISKGVSIKPAREATIDEPVETKIQIIDSNQGDLTQTGEERISNTRTDSTSGSSNNNNLDYQQSQQPPRHEESLTNLREEPVYTNADSSHQFLFDQIIANGLEENDQSGSQWAHFANGLFKNPSKQAYSDLEFYYYDSKYGIGSISKQDELPLCIVTTGDQESVEYPSGNYLRFLDSIRRQDYTNYRLIFLTNGGHDNILFQKFAQYVEDYLPHLTENKKFIMGVNQRHVGEMETRHRNIARFCRKNEVVLDASINDAFIGRQAFKFISAVFGNSTQQVWIADTHNIYRYPKEQRGALRQTLLARPTATASQTIDRLENGRSSQLKLFRQELYTKVDQWSFKKSETNQFYAYGEKELISKPMRDLAGPAYQTFNEAIYFIGSPVEDHPEEKMLEIYGSYLPWLTSPYSPLQNLKAVPQKQQNHQISVQIASAFQKYEEKMQSLGIDF